MSWGSSSRRVAAHSQGGDHDDHGDIGGDRAVRPQCQVVQRQLLRRCRSSSRSTAAGKGLVGVILPDTTSSTRYVDFDAPYLKQGLPDRRLQPVDFKIDNAQGVDATELADAQADVSLGAKVLVFDPIDSTVGSQVAVLRRVARRRPDQLRPSHLHGTKTYYVSFDNNLVGKLIGQGFECVRRVLGYHESQGLRARRR